MSLVWGCRGLRVGWGVNKGVKRPGRAWLVMSWVEVHGVVGVQQEVRPQVVLVEFWWLRVGWGVDFCTLRLVETPTLTCERHDVYEF